jgi:F0F1-type ATP synthase assembly protein I
VFRNSLDPKELGRLLSLAQVGTEMVVPIVAGLLLDRWLGTLPWCTVVGVFLGLILGIIHLVVLNSFSDTPKAPRGSNSNKDAS